MLDKEPLFFPSRDRFPFNPGIPNKQLWAIGMIVAQWSFAEMLIAQYTFSLIASDSELQKKYNAIRNYQQKIEFLETLVVSKKIKDSPTILLHLNRVKQLRSQRDDVIHRCWGGGMQAGDWSAEDHPTTDAVLLKSPADPPSKGDTPLKWNLSFIRLKRMAVEMAELNVQLSLSFT